MLKILVIHILFSVISLSIRLLVGYGIEGWNRLTGEHKEADVELHQQRQQVNCQYKTCIARYDAAFTPSGEGIAENECVVQYRRVRHYYQSQVKRRHEGSSYCPQSEVCTQKDIKRTRCMLLCEQSFLCSVLDVRDKYIS